VAAVLTPLGRPAEYACSLEEAKAYLRVDHSADDDDIGGMIADATEVIEAARDRTLVVRSYRLTLDEFPWGVIELPRGPAVSVTSVAYDGWEDGEELTMDPADLRLTGDRLDAAWGAYWPTPRVQGGAVRVTYTAGYATADDVPRAARRALLWLVLCLYERRPHGDELWRMLDGFGSGGYP
jgi:uncharacterized phiE125 gp8 family phage protein